jgi:hypothetical protein
MKNKILAIGLSGVWISASEFLRNQLLFASLWHKKYESLGIVFPEKPINGMLWGVWSFIFAGCIYVLVRKLSLKEAIVFAWVIGFLQMWLVIGNLGVLPYSLLWYAVPLSILEVLVAVLIIKKSNKI